MAKARCYNDHKIHFTKIILSWSLFLMIDGTYAQSKLNIGVSYLPCYSLSSTSSTQVRPFRSYASLSHSLLPKLSFEFNKSPFTVETGFSKLYLYNSIKDIASALFPYDEGFKKIKLPFYGYAIPFSINVKFLNSYQKFTFATQIGGIYIFDILESINSDVFIKNMLGTAMFTSKRDGDTYTMDYEIIVNHTNNSGFLLETGITSSYAITDKLNFTCSILNIAGFRPLLGNTIIYEISSNRNNSGRVAGEEVFTSKGDAFLLDLGITYTICKFRQKQFGAYD